MSGFTDLQRDTLANLGDVDFEELIAALPGQIRVAETQMNREITIRAQRKRLSPFVLPAGTNTFALPPGFLRPVMMRVMGTTDTQWRQLDLRSAEYVAEAWPDPAYRAKPRQYSLEADTVEIWPIPIEDTTVEFRYIKPIDYLSATNGDNWWTQNAYDLILAQVMMQASKFVLDDRQQNLLQIWGATYAAAAEATTRQDKLSSMDYFEGPKSGRAPPAPAAPEGGA